MPLAPPGGTSRPPACAYEQSRTSRKRVSEIPTFRGPSHLLRLGGLRSPLKRGPRSPLLAGAMPRTGRGRLSVLAQGSRRGQPGRDGRAAASLSLFTDGPASHPTAPEVGASPWQVVRWRSGAVCRPRTTDGSGLNATPSPSARAPLHRPRGARIRLLEGAPGGSAVRPRPPDHVPPRHGQRLVRQQRPHRHARQLLTAVSEQRLRTRTGLTDPAAESTTIIASGQESMSCRNRSPAVRASLRSVTYTTYREHPPRGRPPPARAGNREPSLRSPDVRTPSMNNCVRGCDRPVRSTRPY